jgi:26S proteasome regulatory subunit N2
VLYTDSAVAGEAAGIAMGLLSLGAAEASADAHAAEMLAYAHDTAHEKIIRGLAVGLALMCYGREEGSDSMIEQLTTDQVRACGFAERILMCKPLVCEKMMEFSCEIWVC